MMSKETKTAAELATMIRTRLGEKELRIGVFSNSKSWNAKVYASANAASELQVRVDQAAEQLRKVYDLAN